LLVEVCRGFPVAMALLGSGGGMVVYRISFRNPSHKIGGFFGARCLGAPSRYRWFGVGGSVLSLAGLDLVFRSSRRG